MKKFLIEEIVRLDEGPNQAVPAGREARSPLAAAPAGRGGGGLLDAGRAAEDALAVPGGIGQEEGGPQVTKNAAHCPKIIIHQGRYEKQR